MLGVVTLRVNRASLNTRFRKSSVRVGADDEATFATNRTLSLIRRTTAGLHSIYDVRAGLRRDWTYGMSRNGRHPGLYKNYDRYFIVCSISPVYGLHLRVARKGSGV